MQVRSDPFAQAQPALFRLLENKLWLDELYEKTVVAGSAILGARI